MRRVILTLAVPTIVSMLITSIYNIASTFYVGRISTQATAAVGIAFSYMAVVQAIGFMFGQGSGNYISRELGARNRENAGRMSIVGFVLAIATGLLFSVLGFVFLRPLCMLLGSTETILPDAERYMRWVLASTPFMCGAFVLNNQMRFQGNAKYAMYGIVSGALLFIALAPVLIFVLDMGIDGAGMATFIGQAASFAVLLRMMRRGGTVPLDPSLFGGVGKCWKEILAGGTPSLTRQGLASISIALMNNAAGLYGDAAIAAMSIVGRVTYVVLAIIIGLGQGFQPLCGFCYGAGLYSRVRKGYGFILRLGLVILFSSSVLGFLFSGAVIGIFRHDPDVIRIGTDALRWQLLTLPCVAPIMFTNMTLQTTRHPVSANLLALSRNGLFFIPPILVLPSFLGLTGVEITPTVSDVLSAALAIAVAIPFFRRLPREDRKIR